MKIHILHEGEITKLDVTTDNLELALKAIKEIIYYPPSEVEIIVKYKTSDKAILSRSKEL